MEIPKTRKELFEILRQHNSGDRNDQCSYLKDYVITEMGLQNLSREESRNVRNTISRFCSKLFQKWEDCKRKNYRFFFVKMQFGLNKKKFFQSMYLYMKKNQVGIQ